MSMKFPLHPAPGRELPLEGSESSSKNAGSSRSREISPNHAAAAELKKELFGQSYESNTQRDASSRLSPRLGGPSQMAAFNRPGIGDLKATAQTTIKGNRSSSSTTPVEVGRVYSDGTHLSPLDSRIVSKNAKNKWVQHVSVPVDKKLFQQAGITDKRAFIREANRIVRSPTSENIPGFVRRRDNAVVRYDKTKDLFLVADSKGRVITMFPPTSGFSEFSEELAK